VAAARLQPVRRCRYCDFDFHFLRSESQSRSISGECCARQGAGTSASLSYRFISAVYGVSRLPGVATQVTSRDRLDIGACVYCAIVTSHRGVTECVCECVCVCVALPTGYELPTVYYTISLSLSLSLSLFVQMYVAV